MKYKRWSIIFLSISFIILSVLIALVQWKIDSKKSAYYDYLVNMQQSNLKYSEFLDKYDTGQYLDIVLQEKTLPAKHYNLISRIQEKLKSRCRELLASSIVSVSIGPKETATDALKRLPALEKKPIDELTKILDSYRGSNLPANVISKKISFFTKFKLALYFFGSAFFILGTIFQIISEKSN